MVQALAGPLNHSRNNETRSFNSIFRGGKKTWTDLLLKIVFRVESIDFFKPSHRDEMISVSETYHTIPGYVCAEDHRPVHHCKSIPSKSHSKQRNWVARVDRETNVVFISLKNKHFLNCLWWFMNEQTGRPARLQDNVTLIFTTNCREIYLYRITIKFYVVGKTGFEKTVMSLKIEKLHISARARYTWI